MISTSECGLVQSASFLLWTWLEDRQTIARVLWSGDPAAGMQVLRVPAISAFTWLNRHRLLHLLHVLGAIGLHSCAPRLRGYRRWAQQTFQKFIHKCHLLLWNAVGWRLRCLWTEFLPACDHFYPRHFHVTLGIGVYKIA